MAAGATHLAARRRDRVVSRGIEADRSTRGQCGGADSLNTELSGVNLDFGLRFAPPFPTVMIGHSLLLIVTISDLLYQEHHYK